MSKPTHAIASRAIDSQTGGQSSFPTAPRGRQYTAGPVQDSRIVPKPVPQNQKLNPRAFQIRQIRRRYSPEESNTERGTSLSFNLIPSDPDFPYELSALRCLLHVPKAYPQNRTVNLTISNKDIPKGYQLNVESGFTGLLKEMPNATLLSLLNTLDRRLETFLAQEKQDTVKLVSNAPAMTPTGGSVPTRGPSAQATVQAEAPASGPKSFSAAQLAHARSTREMHLRQLEARLGRDPLFSKTADGLSFTVPLEPRKRCELPVPLQAVKSVKLTVPELYNLQPCKLELIGVSRDAALGVEKAINLMTKRQTETTLIQHLNYLTQNLITLATAEPVADRPQPSTIDASSGGLIRESLISEKSITAPESREQPTDTERSHVKIIPRPPEWSIEKHDPNDSSGNSDYSSYDSGDETEEGEGNSKPEADTTATSSSVERGTSISFPSLELYGIELLELALLSITVKCDRCKQTLDVTKLRPSGSEPSGTRLESCQKCVNGLSIGTFNTSDVDNGDILANQDQDIEKS
ncbi:MAG: hypothetical protein M1817_003142 [Caeruleum heppii]|nr:MAG: hypothetical protein M1817_003142 [Caeruleum heppii]